MTVYTNLYEINTNQQSIVKFMITWVHTEKVPIPQKKIIEFMINEGSNKSTVVHNLNGLIKLGYIRRAMVQPSNSTSYVLLRTL